MQGNSNLVATSAACLMSRSYDIIHGTTELTSWPVQNAFWQLSKSLNNNINNLCHDLYSITITTPSTNEQSIGI